MLNKCLDAYDVHHAYRIILKDDEVDMAKNMIRSFSEENMQKDSGKYVYLTMLLSVSRSLERSADHETNISENIIYMLQGKIIRHVIDNVEPSITQPTDTGN